MPSLESILTPEKAFIFRITHRANIPWILLHGLHCPGTGHDDPNFVGIGDPDLIVKRTHRPVPTGPGGTLKDYVPFYFTPLSPMLYNIKTGYGNLTRRGNQEIVVLVSSLAALKEQGVRYVFTDRHAYLAAATFFTDDEQLALAVDYALLRSRDFRHDREHPDRFERYQAETLAHHHVPVSAILGIGCYTAAIATEIEAQCLTAGAAVHAVHRPEWYF